jgi:hypothetical protein
MANIELSALQRQCLDRRLGDRATLARVMAAWAAARNGIRVLLRLPRAGCDTRAG